jgi:hypothetical protein
MTVFSLVNEVGRTIAEVGVAAHVDGRQDNPWGGEHTVDLLLMTSWKYDKVMAEKILNLLTDRYVGKPYGEWPR